RADGVRVVSRYTADSRDRVRDAVDMLALVGSRVELTRRGHDSYFGCCPFHDERTASFHVRPDEKYYHCFGCSESGDPFTFVMATEGLDFKGALEALADRFGVTLETEDESPEAAGRRQRRERLYALLDRSATFYERYLWEARDAEPARTYLRDRGFDERILREFRVGFAPRSWDRLVGASRGAGYSAEELLACDLGRRKRARPDELIDRFRGRLMFPTADARGRVRGFGARTMGGDDDGPKYLNTAEGEVYRKREVLYGIAQARATAAREGRMILCEGYTDVLALHQAGVTNAVGIMGTSLTDEQVAELVRVVKVLELCLDADNAGQRAMERAAQGCADSGLQLRVVPLPVGTDPGELIAAEGADALRRRISQSVPYVVFHVRRVLETADLSGAEGKDGAIAALRPVLAGVAPSVLRDELVRDAAAALAIPEARLVALLGPASPSSAARPPDPLRRPGPDAAPPAPAPRAANGRRAQRPEPERSFLAMCVAAPDLGAAALAQIDPDALLVDDVLRRAARFLALHLPDAPPDPPGEDPELILVIDDLRARAARGRSVNVDELEHARLVLERDRLSREIRYLRDHGGGGGTLARLSAEHQQVLATIRTIVSRLERPV
ncbi:MAG TPA: DNA primase, partial [Solirubrobacteraceae bacterium]|nr:DNA primase [Solirubrobacteraceae bacterium]